MVRMRACPKHASERSLYCIGLSKGLSVAGWLRHPGARPSARSQRRAILAPGCARRPGGRTPVQSARRVPRLATRLARQLAFLRKPMTAHGVPLLRRGFNGASCAAPAPAMLAAPCGSHRVRRRLAAGRGAMARPSLHPPPGARRPAGCTPPPRRASAEPAPDGVGLASRNAPGGGTRLVSPRMRRLRHSRRKTEPSSLARATARFAGARFQIRNTQRTGKTRHGHGEDAATPKTDRVRYWGNRSVAGA